MKLRLAVSPLLLCLRIVSAQQVNGEADFQALSKRAAIALSNDPSAAAVLYRQGVQMRPEWAEGWFYLGASLFETGQFADSKQALKKAAALVPERGTVWGFLGLTENQLGEKQRALADLRKGESLGLADDLKFISSIRTTAALICIQQGDFGGAVSQLRDLAILGERSDSVVDELGVSVLGLPMISAQTPPLQRSLILDAGQAAWAFYAHKMDEAAARLQKLADQYPNTPGVHYLNGIYLLGRDKNAAAREFGKELHLVPGHVAARLQLAMLDIQSGKPEEAGQLAADAQKIDDRNPLAFLIAGRAMLDEKRFSDAIGPLATAATLAPENAEAHLYLAQAYRRMGKTEDALRERREFEMRKPANDPVLFDKEPHSTSRSEPKVQ